MSDYWAERARILAERDTPQPEPTAAPKKQRAAAAEIEQPPAVEPPADGGLNHKE